MICHADRTPLGVFQTQNLRSVRVIDWLPLSAHSLWGTKEGEDFSSSALVIIEHAVMQG